MLQPFFVVEVVWLQPPKHQEVCPRSGSLGSRFLPILAAWPRRKRQSSMARKIFDKSIMVNPRNFSRFATDRHWLRRFWHKIPQRNFQQSWEGFGLAKAFETQIGLFRLVFFCCFAADGVNNPCFIFISPSGELT